MLAVGVRRGKAALDQIIHVQTRDWLASGPIATCRADRSSWSACPAPIVVTQRNGLTGKLTGNFAAFWRVKKLFRRVCAQIQ
jgi:hypothetical protein